MLFGGRPGRECQVIRWNPEDGKRHSGELVWGLLPFNTPDPDAVEHPVWAPAEALLTDPRFAPAFRKRRCLVPADEFYVGGAGKEASAIITRKDDQTMGLGGLWESFSVIRRPGATPPSLLGSITCNADRRQDPAPIHIC